MKDENLKKENKVIIIERKILQNILTSNINCESFDEFAGFCDALGNAVPLSEFSEYGCSYFENSNLTNHDLIQLKNLLILDLKDELNNQENSFVKIAKVIEALELIGVGIIIQKKGFKKMVVLNYREVLIDLGYELPMILKKVSLLDDLFIEIEKN